MSHVIAAATVNNGVFCISIRNNVRRRWCRVFSHISGCHYQLHGRLSVPPYMSRRKKLKHRLQFCIIYQLGKGCGIYVDKCIGFFNSQLCYWHMWKHYQRFLQCAKWRLEATIKQMLCTQLIFITTFSRSQYGIFVFTIMNITTTPRCRNGCSHWAHDVIATLSQGRYSRADYSPNQVKLWAAGQKYETLHSYSFENTEQFQKGSPKIVVNSFDKNHVLRDHGSAKKLNQ